MTKPSPLPDRGNSDLVLIVDDVPDNLAVLRDALDESGFTVLVATSGAAALQCAVQARPDIVLLDAMMPGMDGFAVARHLKADPQTAAIPIVFMTGLLDTDHLVAALESGGVDYVTKPIKPKEVLARMTVHLRSAREKRQARNALDAFGYASIAVRVMDGRLLWETPLARALLEEYCGAAAPVTAPEILSWIATSIKLLKMGLDPAKFVLEKGAKRLTMRLHQQIGDSDEGDDWLIVMRETSDAAVIDAMGLSLGLTPREAEVLYWLIKGKAHKDIGDLLGSSPMAVKTHLEHIYEKLGVETPMAAVGMAVDCIRQLHPQWEA